MISPLHLHRTSAERRPARRTAVLFPLVRTGLTGRSARGKAVSIVDSPRASASSTAAPACFQAAPPAQAGTVIGAAAKCERLSVAQSPDLGTRLANVNQAALYRFDMDGRHG